MLELDDCSIDVPCPRCSFYNVVTLREIRLRDAVICRGCKATIQYEDHMNETRKVVKSFSRAMRELEEQFNKIGTITIRL